MIIEDIRVYCLSKQFTTEDMPFDDSTLVFRVYNKIFALLSLDGNMHLNLKCEPEKAIELREHYSCIIPGFHMNKKHWNTIILSGNIEKKSVFQLIDHSYDLVVRGLAAHQRKTIL
ncbi:MAG: MmcQ/YjbR family DNA-binding protein [Bacteroidales bacterium]|nr:MmcQ/YjbR family DNA-binding protein [Bacteroidales bacterium]